jgi:hypothetical protein
LLIKAAGTALQFVPQINLNTKGDDDVQVHVLLSKIFTI